MPEPEKLSRSNVSASAGVVALLVLLVTIVALAAPGRAAAYVYWANGGDAGIGRANLDGTGIDQSFIEVETPEGLATDGTHIFWSEYNAGTIGRANLDGTGVEPSFIAGAPMPFGLAAGNGHVYWASLGENAIGRADLDGTDVESSFIDASGPYGVAADAEHIYWVNGGGGTIGRANLEGGELDQDFITAPGAIAIAVDAHHIYWTDNSTGAIERANLDGSDVEPSFITGAASPQAIAVDANHVYWASYTYGTIGRADLDGSEVDQEFIVGGNRVLGLAVDSLPHGSATTVSCAPSPVTEPAAASCTATVSDTGPYPALPGPVAPTGKVSFGSGVSCTLQAAGSGRSSCAVSYQPSSPGTATISASYPGDSAHGASHGSATLTVAPVPAAISNAFKLGRPKLNRRKGTASVVATVPGPGKLTLAGHGLRRAARVAAQAGKVTLALKPTKVDRRELDRTHRAKAAFTVTYVPTGGKAAHRRGKVTLRLARVGGHR